MKKTYNHSDFSGAPWQQGTKREKALARGLRRFAKQHGIEFKEPLTINTMGEFYLVVTNQHSLVNTGGGFQSAAPIIGKYGIRTGVSYSHHVIPENGWGWMNHFAVQQMLEENL